MYYTPFVHSQRVFRVTYGKYFHSSSIIAHLPVANRTLRPPRPSVVLKVTIPHHEKSFDLTWKLGDSLKDLAEQNDDLMAEYIEGICGGNMSCSTCHVYIDQPEFQALLHEPEEAERDMLVRQ